jgi:hypothetical protein
MDSNQAKQTLRKLAKEGCIVISRHCREQMEKRNVTTEDILHVLMWGDIQGIKKNDKHNNWQMEVEGKDLDGDKLTVQAAVSEEERTIVITVY